MRNYILVIGIAFFFNSCEKEIPLDDQEKAPRIVINGIFSANDTMRIHISESRNILYEGELPNITNADAKLLDANGNVIGTFLHEGDGYYVMTEVIPQVGSVYGITVAATGFTSVSASSYTPEVLSSVQIDTLRTGETMKYEIIFQDDPNEINYYSLSLKKLYYYYDSWTGDTVLYEDNYFCTNEVIVQSGYSDVNGDICGMAMLFSDATFNGQNYSFSCSNYISVWEDTCRMVATLSSVSEDYYKYNVTLAKYEQTQGDPFAQPVQVYSNIENGFGIFGGYSSFSDTLIIP